MKEEVLFIMTKKDIMEIRRRFKKDVVTIDKIACCYVNNEKNVVTKFNETFLNMEDEDFFKYLEVAKKSLSGKIGNNLQQLEFAASEDDKTQDMLLRLRDSRLMDQEILDEFFEHVIDTYDTVENYLIVLFHDTYDVVGKASDGATLEDSSETFEYVLCAICPVKLQKAALGYITPENTIAHIQRDWIVSPVESAFMFPAFDDRQANIHTVVTYTKNPKDPHVEFIENTLGAEFETTAAIKQMAFREAIVESARDENLESVMFDINLAVSDYIDTEAEKDEIVRIDADTLSDILADTDLDEATTEKVCEKFTKFFGDDNTVVATDIVDNAAIKNAELVIEIRNLKQRLVALCAEVKELKGD